MTPKAETVTILFTDLVNSTELLQRIGDETAQRVLETHHRFLRDAVAAYGGAEVKWTGDGLMVAFTSATAAVRCAVAMQQAARRPAAGEPLHIRVGLHVGEALRHDATDYFGTTVVVASRLCAQARAGEILCTAVVRALISDGSAVDFRDRGELALKGIAAPVSACEVLYEHDSAAMLAVTPFVGRGDVIAALSQKLEETRAGRGSLAMLVGEPGIGKTRAAEEFAAFARHQGATVLRGCCYDGDWAPPFSPFVEAIRAHVAVTPPERLAAELGADAGVLARIVPALGERLPEIAEPPTLQPEGERYRLLESVSNVLARIAAFAPLVLLLDDLHWADKGTIAMLRQVARVAPEHSLLLIGAYRDIELDRTHPLAEALPALRRETQYERFVLKGLQPAEVGDLLSLVAEQRVPEDFARTISEETGGNPFFIREVMLHLVEEKKIVQEDGRWVSAGSIVDMRIPEGVREVIGRRVSRVSDTTNRMLTVASALTAGFSWDLIAALVDAEETTLLDALDEGLTAQLIVEQERGRYDFTHALIRHTLYEEQSTPRRVLLHRQIGETLERLYAAEIEEHLAEVGHHFYQAASSGLVEKAIDYARRAADNATARAAYDVAVTQYEHALELAAMVGGDDSERCRLSIALAEAQWKTGDMVRSIESYGVAAEIAKAGGLARELAVAALGYAGEPEYVWGGPDRVARLQDAVEALSSDADRPYLAMVLARLELAVVALTDEMRALRSGVLRYAPDGELSAKALEIAREAGDVGALAYTIRARLRVLWENAVPVPEFRRLAEELCSIAESRGDRGLLAHARMWLLMDLLSVGDMTPFDAMFAENKGLITRLHEAYHIYIDALLDGGLSIMRGDFVGAERKAQDALAIGERAKLPGVVNTFGAQLLPIRREQGRSDEVEPVVRSFLQQYPDSVFLRSVFAILHLELGREQEAREVYEPLAEALFSLLERDQSLPITLALLAEVAGRLGDAEGSAILYERLLPWRDRQLMFTQAFSYGSTGRQLGILAGTMGRWEDAVRHFKDALAMNTRMGARPWVAHTKFDYATMLLRRNDAGDSEHARDLLQQALETAQDIGMVKLAEGCEALLSNAR